MPTPWLDWRVDSMGMPDGAAMDQEGCYWSCGIFAGAIHRFDQSGTHLESYCLPISQPTMCCFGGDDLRTLFVTSMTLRLDAVQRASQPLAGTVIAFRVGVAGAPVGVFE
jgi:sugar lactone lactonase YvrE